MVSPALQVSHVGPSMCFFIDAATYALAAWCAHMLKVAFHAMLSSYSPHLCPAAASFQRQCINIRVDAVGVAPAGGCGTCRA